MFSVSQGSLQVFQPKIWEAFQTAQGLMQQNCATAAHTMTLETFLFIPDREEPLGPRHNFKPTKEGVSIFRLYHVPASHL
jgi:hypothetical protein